MNKNKSNSAVHGGIKDLKPATLGPLEMRVLEAAGNLGITFMHELLPAKSSTPRVIHSKTTELVYLSKGKMVAYLNRKRVVIKEGDYILIPAGVEHVFETGGTIAEAISIFSPQLNMNKPDARIAARDTARTIKIKK